MAGYQALGDTLWRGRREIPGTALWHSAGDSKRHIQVGLVLMQDYSIRHNDMFMLQFDFRLFVLWCWFPSPAIAFVYCVAKQVVTSIAFV